MIFHTEITLEMYWKIKFIKIYMDLRSCYTVIKYVNHIYFENPILKIVFRYVFTM